jgi:hypothetical protein
LRTSGFVAKVRAQFREHCGKSTSPYLLSA